MLQRSTVNVGIVEATRRKCSLEHFLLGKTRNVLEES